MTSTNSETEVLLYVYDLTQGMARAMSTMFIGKQLEAIWHTGIVVFGMEIFFGGDGIKQCPKGCTPLGSPLKIVRLGTTQIPHDLFQDFIASLSQTTYRGRDYDLFHHNCNNFSEEVAQFLTGKSIPSEILDLPKEVLNTQMGQMIKNMFSPANPSTTSADNNFPFFNNITSTNPSTSFASVPNHQQHNGTQATKTPAIPSSTTNFITFNSLDLADVISKLKSKTQDHHEIFNNFYMHYKLGKPTFTSTKEERYNCLVKLLNNNDTEIVTLSLQLLQYLSLEDDLGEILVFDKNEHGLISFFKKLTSTHLSPIQTESCKFLCNLSSKQSGVKWLMDTTPLKSPLPSDGNQQVITQLLLFMILTPESEVKQLATTALVNISYNWVHFENADNFSLECVSAVIQLLDASSPTAKDEHTAFLVLTVLQNLIQLENIPSLIEALNPDFQSLRTLSTRVDLLVKNITSKTTNSR